MTELDRNNIPQHVAIIMDGNGRWAQRRGLLRTAGHTAGGDALKQGLKAAIDLELPALTVYAFSTENWKRSPSEVAFIMRFSTEVLNRQLETLKSWGVRIRWAGRRPKLWKNVIEQLEQCERETRNNTICTLTMCVNYGGRAEIADAAAAIARDVQAGTLKPNAITEKTFQKYLDEPDLPDVDLFLRSSGEQRISNFLLWQSAYAEMVFMNVLWPDVDRRTLYKAVEEYAHRDRRYGGATDKIPAQTTN